MLRLWPGVADAIRTAKEAGVHHITRRCGRIAARAEPGERGRHIGVLMYLGEGGDAEGQARLAAFAQALGQLGWTEGRNLRTETRWANADDIRRRATELVALAPDVLLAGTGTPTLAPLIEATRS